MDAAIQNGAVIYDLIDGIFLLRRHNLAVWLWIWRRNGPAILRVILWRLSLGLLDVWRSMMIQLIDLCRTVMNKLRWVLGNMDCTVMWALSNSSSLRWIHSWLSFLCLIFNWNNLDRLTSRTHSSWLRVHMFLIRRSVCVIKIDCLTWWRFCQSSLNNLSSGNNSVRARWNSIVCGGCSWLCCEIDSTWALLNKGIACRVNRLIHNLTLI